MQDSLTLVLGGARSGKSSYGQQLASAVRKVLFIATAIPGDAEMRAKISRHRSDRLTDKLPWNVLEEPLQLGKNILAGGFDLILIDCLTLFVGNLMRFEPKRQQMLIDGFCAALEKRICPIVLISNEVGSGVVPEFVSGRQYRDTLGELNQRVAALATDVVLMVAGLPLPLKSGGSR